MRTVTKRPTTSASSPRGPRAESPLRVASSMTSRLAERDRVRPTGQSRRRGTSPDTTGARRASCPRRGMHDQLVVRAVGPTREKHTRHWISSSSLSAAARSAARAAATRAGSGGPPGRTPPPRWFPTAGSTSAHASSLVVPRPPAEPARARRRRAPPPTNRCCGPPPDGDAVQEGAPSGRTRNPSSLRRRFRGRPVFSHHGAAPSRKAPNLRQKGTRDGSCWRAPVSSFATLTRRRRTLLGERQAKRTQGSMAPPGAGRSWRW